MNQTGIDTREPPEGPHRRIGAGPGAGPPHGILSSVTQRRWRTVADRVRVRPPHRHGSRRARADRVGRPSSSDVRLTHHRPSVDRGRHRTCPGRALADAIRQAAEHGEHLTPETLRAELAGLESRLYRAMLVQAGAIVGALVGIGGIVVGVLRLFG